jgi:hypothetical protein
VERSRDAPWDGQCCVRTRSTGTIEQGRWESVCVGGSGDRVVRQEEGLLYIPMAHVQSLDVGQGACEHCIMQCAQRTLVGPVDMWTVQPHYLAHSSCGPQAYNLWLVLWFCLGYQAMHPISDCLEPPSVTRLSLRHSFINQHQIPECPHPMITTPLVYICYRNSLVATSQHVISTCHTAQNVICAGLVFRSDFFSCTIQHPAKNCTKTVADGSISVRKVHHN